MKINEHEKGAQKEINEGKQEGKRNGNNNREDDEEKLNKRRKQITT